MRRPSSRLKRGLTLRRLVFVCAFLGASVAAYLLVISPPSTTAPSRSSSLLFDGRFQSAGLNSWPGVLNFKMPTNSNRLSYVTSPRRRSTGHAAKLEVGGEDMKGERIEFGPLNLWDNDVEGREVWIALSHFIPSGQTLPDRMILFQRNSKLQHLVCAPSGFGFGDAIQIQNPTAGQPADRWQFHTNGGVDGCTTKVWPIPNLAVVRDAWIDWLVHYRLHSTKSAGPITEVFYRVDNGNWVNPISDTAQPNLVRTAASQGNFRWGGGLYKDESYTPYTTVYFGGLVIAPTRADAEAAMFD